MCSRDEYVESCKEKFDDLQRDGKVLLRYARNRKNQKVGVIVAFRDIQNHQVYIGYSRCNESSGDHFNKYVGIVKAVEKSVPAVDSYKLCVPHSMIELFNHQYNKIVSYFKDLV